MKVLKFGGSSVGSVSSILSVKKIVEAVEDPVIVVVSALGGITDKLIEVSQMAANGNPAYEKELASAIISKIKEYDIPSDGLVLSFDDIEYGISLGMTNKFPKRVKEYLPRYFPYQRPIAEDLGYYPELW